MNLTKTTKVYFGLDGYISNYTSPGGQNTNTVWSAVRQLTPLMFPKTYSDGTFLLMENMTLLLRMSC